MNETSRTRHAALKELLSRLCDVYGSRRVMNVAAEIGRERQDPLSYCSSRLYVHWEPMKRFGIEFLVCQGNYDHVGDHYGRLGDCAASWAYVDEVGRYIGSGISSAYYALGPKCSELFCHATEGHKGEHENPWTTPTRWKTGEGQQR